MATQGPALNEKPRYCWLNSDKMDGSDENGMVIKMAARTISSFLYPRIFYYIIHFYTCIFSIFFSFFF